MENNSGAKFSSNFGFIMAAVGSAVGLGNIWGFPYKMGSTGGFVFIVIYLILMVTVGFAVMLGEFAIGRSTGRAPVGAYSSLPKKWTFLGFMGVAAGILILSFYAVIGGWVMKYMVAFFQEMIGMGGFGDASSADYFVGFITSNVEPIFWVGLFMILTALIVMAGIDKGIERFSKFMMPALFVIILVIIVRSLTLEGAFKGVEFMFSPDFSVVEELGWFNIASTALAQMFFSLSLGMGAMITYGSYLDKKENLEKNAIIVPVLDTMVALLAGLAVMPAVFALGFEPTQGPGLMFIVLRDVFLGMPAGTIIGFVFFVLVFFAAITSAISLLEVAASYLIDSKKMERKKAVLIMLVVIFVLGNIPIALSQGLLSNIRIPCPIGKVVDYGSFQGMLTVDLLDFFDWMGEYVFMTLGSCLMSIYIGWIWGPENVIKEVESNGNTFKLKGYWTFCIKWLAPPITFILFLSASGILGLFGIA